VSALRAGSYAGAMTTDRPLSLLYVCTASIRRSAYAEVLTGHLADDVADPYGRGSEAAATAARQIEQHVRRVVGALTGETMEVS
jgi:protein-tyrosine-phosphatase